MYTIILCDDEFFVREMLKRAIDWEQTGLRIIGEAGTGNEAVVLAKELCPDAMLLDINMPLQNGLDALEEIRKWNLDMEIIVVTGYDLFEYAYRGIKLRVFDYLIKPVDDRELRETCGRLVTSLSERDKAKPDAIEQMVPEETSGFQSGAARLHQHTASDDGGYEALNKELQRFPFEQIAVELRLGRTEECMAQFSRFFDTLTGQAYHLNADLIKTICCDVMNYVMVNYYGLNEYSAKMMLKTEIDAEIRKLDSLESIREWMIGILRCLCEPGSISPKAKPPYVRLARAVVSDNLLNPELSVAFVSKQLYINTSYLSHFFKKEYGVGLNDYITDERMKLAQEILRAECLKIEEMALRVGYRNADYFGKRFKKKFGVPYSTMKMSYHQ